MRVTWHDTLIVDSDETLVVEGNRDFPEPQSTERAVDSEGWAAAGPGCF